MDRNEKRPRPEKKLQAVGWESLVELLIFWEPPLDWERLPAQPQRDDDDDRRLPGHLRGQPSNICVECPRLAQLSLLNAARSSQERPGGRLATPPVD